MRMYFVTQDRDEELRQYWQKLGRGFSVTKLKSYGELRSVLLFIKFTKAGRVQKQSSFAHACYRFSSLTQSLDFSNSFLLFISIKVFSLVPAVPQNTRG